MNEDDRELFQKALDNLPSDIRSAKFGGFTGPEKRRRDRSKPVHDIVLDLHGMTRKTALVRLENTLSLAKGKRRRILVITGRGNRSEYGIGVLRDEVARYLETAGARYIREFGFAASEYGGDGAFDLLTK